MIRHVVLWKFREGTKQEQDTFLDGLAALYGVIPQLKRCEVLRNCAPGNYDAALIADFDTWADLDTYKNDPRHVALSSLCADIRVDRVAVDSEIR